MNINFFILFFYFSFNVLNVFSMDNHNNLSKDKKSKTVKNSFKDLKSIIKKDHLQVINKVKIDDVKLDMDFKLDIDKTLIPKTFSQLNINDDFKNQDLNAIHDLITDILKIQQYVVDQGWKGNSQTPEQIAEKIKKEFKNQENNQNIASSFMGVIRKNAGIRFGLFLGMYYKYYEEIDKLKCSKKSINTFHCTISLRKKKKKNKK